MDRQFTPNDMNNFEEYMKQNNVLTIIDSPQSIDTEKLLNLNQSSQEFSNTQSSSRVTEQQELEETSGPQPPPPTADDDKSSNGFDNEPGHLSPANALTASHTDNESIIVESDEELEEDTVHPAHHVPEGEFELSENYHEEDEDENTQTLMNTTIETQTDTETRQMDDVRHENHETGAIAKVFPYSYLNNYFDSDEYDKNSHHYILQDIKNQDQQQQTTTNSILPKIPSSSSSVDNNNNPTPPTTSTTSPAITAIDTTTHQPPHPPNKKMDNTSWSALQQQTTRNEGINVIMPGPPNTIYDNEISSTGEQHGNERYQQERYENVPYGFVQKPTSRVLTLESETSVDYPTQHRQEDSHSSNPFLTQHLNLHSASSPPEAIETTVHPTSRSHHNTSYNSTARQQANVPTSESQFSHSPLLQQTHQPALTSQHNLPPPSQQTIHTQHHHRQPDTSQDKETSSCMGSGGGGNGMPVIHRSGSLAVGNKESNKQFSSQHSGSVRRNRSSRKQKKFDNTYNSLPNMKKSWLLCCQIIAITICFIAWLAAMFSYITSDWQQATIDDKKGTSIRIGLWQVSYVRTLPPKYTTFSSFGGWLPLSLQEELPEYIYIGRILMTCAISIGILGFSFGILGSSLSCCDRSWVATCSVQTLACLMMGLSTCFLGAMAIIFPYLFNKPGEMEILKYQAYTSIFGRNSPIKDSGDPYKNPDLLAFNYGLSLYLCWAAMVLSGVATAIYAFSTCLLCAEFKLARERNDLATTQVFSYQSANQSTTFSEKGSSSQTAPIQRGRPHTIAASGTTTTLANGKQYHRVPQHDSKTLPPPQQKYKHPDLDSVVANDGTPGRYNTGGGHSKVAKWQEPSKNTNHNNNTEKIQKSSQKSSLKVQTPKSQTVSGSTDGSSSKKHSVV